MKLTSGVDLVYIPRFKKVLKIGGENFLRRVFVDSELSQGPEHLAGIFAAKEAVMKALGLSKGAWQDIAITHQRDGAPQATVSSYELRIKSSSLSVSHDGNYVIAQFVAILER